MRNPFHKPHFVDISPYSSNIVCMKNGIRADTLLLGLFGNPVEHSISPLFMNYALDSLGVNCIYTAFRIQPENIEQAVHALRVLGFRGANVTIPFKSAVIPCLHAIDENAERIGAVNCIVNDNGSLSGYNTDHIGFIKPLSDRGIRISGKRVLVIGSGGAARAVVYSLIKAQVNKITVINRSRDRAESLVTWCRERLGFSAVRYAGENEDMLTAHEKSCELIVNATPVGMFPDTGNAPLSEAFSFHREQTVYDLIYNPEKTSLLKRAKKQGANTLNGFEMLILQGLHSLVRWFPSYEEKILSLKESVIGYMKKG